MKKTTLLKIFCSVFSVVLLMSSCLGDGDSSFTIERDFAYITSSDGYGINKYAVTPNGNIVNDVISKLTEGECYYIGYKVTSTTADGYFSAEYVNVLDNGLAIPRQNILYATPYSNLLNRNDTITPKSLSIGAWSAGKMIGDNWLISYNMTQKGDDKVTAYFYYDANNQKDSEGALKANQIIIDIRFAITDPGTDPNITNTFSAVGNLGSLRSRYSPDFSGAEYVNVPVRFRYQRFTSAGQPAEVAYLGTWQLDSSSSTGNYFIQFTK